LHSRFELLLPDAAGIESLRHRIAGLHRRKTAKKYKRIAILRVEERTENLHAVRELRGNGAREEDADEFVAPAALDLVGAHFDDHRAPPRGMENTVASVSFDGSGTPASNLLP